jgi:NAD(P)-dependent dehydrogenase (short-subunit alcohol dehydrogenase family)
MSGEFTDKCVLVSGGTRGIGLASARKFADEGARVVVCGSNQKNLDLAVEDLKQRSPGSFGIQCDVSKPEEINHLFAEIESGFGRLDVCMVSAGIFPLTRIDDISIEEIDRTLNINVKGLFWVSQQAGRLMQKKGSGSIIHVGSMCGFVAGSEDTGLASYCASKGAAHMLTKSFAAEYGPMGIRVNGIAPGWIATDMNAETREDPDEMATYTRMIPLGRFGEPEEVAELAAFLASDEASFVNGAIVVIDGGNMSL